MKIFILIILLFFFKFVQSQSLETQKVEFKDCNCLEASNITKDTIRISLKGMAMRVSCKISDSYRVTYNILLKGNKMWKHGNFYTHSLRDSLHYTNAYYQLDSLTGFSYNYQDYLNSVDVIEVYDIQDNEIDGDYVEYRNGLLAKSGYFSSGVKDSLWISYHGNRKEKSRGNYLPRKIKIDYSSESDKIYEIQNFTDTFNIVPFAEYQSIIQKYNYTDELIRFPIEIEFKVGLWEYYDKNGDLIKREIYDENGRLVEKK